MIIYNVTINVEEEIEKEWLIWMQETHIPEVLQTKKFQSALMTKVRVEEDMGGVTYSVQYSCPSQEMLEAYYNEDQERMQLSANKFAGKFVAFRTELELISQH
ncbi:DUF4286 family protein [Dokdonia sp. Hel_I_53]|uniref:DUF4286 family protein n=1 Tax=Dokdonia sp. Hel_I_53 TaxID=1566287 RepID=UPI00119B7BE1|nr:DUF4286 family protein [Dokdonia sp. Hel_I_53]TVZ52498.1 uncharacterized protein DUF4286 [Dokdonia sp. Hel_I_53]